MSIFRNNYILQHPCGTQTGKSFWGGGGESFLVYSREFINGLSQIQSGKQTKKTFLFTQ